MTEQVGLDALNGDLNLDLSSAVYSNFYREFKDEYNISCTYCTEETSISQLKQKDSNDFILMSCNIQSFLSKKNEFTNLLDKYTENKVPPSIISFQETWFSDTTNFDLLTIRNYKWHVRSRNNRGGGVATLVNNMFSSEELFQDLHLDNIFESLILRVSYNNFSCIVINLYRPPKDIHNSNKDAFDDSPDVVLFLDRLAVLLHRLEDYSCPIYMSGDHNLNLFSCTVRTSNACKFLEHLIFSGFLNLTFKATRISQSSHSLIDGVVVKNCINKLQCNQIIVSDLSDHFVLLSSFSTSDKLKKPKPSPFFFKRILSDNNINSLRDALRLNNWDEVHSQTNVNSAFSLFISKFIELYDTHCPLKEFKFNKKHMPINDFMNDALLKCRSFKQYLFRLKQTTKTAENITRYKHYKNRYNKAVRRARVHNYHSQIKSAGRDSKKIWKVIKSVVGLSKESSPVEFVEVDNEKIYGATNIANSFNQFFSKLGENLTPKIPTTTYSFREFLPPPMANSIFIEPLTPVSVFNLIKSIKPKHSCDNDGLSMFLISSIAEGICAPLSSIYNLSLQTGVFPDKLTISKTIVIHKGGSLSAMNQFRGVSLIPTLSKPLERYVYNTVYSFLDNNSFFSPRQFGFRAKYSTIHNALDLYNLVTETLAAGRSCLSIFVDIQKCFDMVDRDILLSKLENSGIRGPLLSWFRSYYENRRQRVFFNGKFSTTLEDIMLGILQGSILGVLCFLIMVNDLVHSIPPAIADLFADDSQMFLAADNLEQLINITNDCLPKIIGWYSANRLLIHPNKTKIIIYKTPLQRYSPEDLVLKTNPPIFVDLNNINESFPDKINQICSVPNDSEKSIRHLGIFIDDQLSFNSHFDQLYNKLQKAIYTLKQMRNILDRRHLMLLYNSYVRSHLEYGIIMYSACSLSLINPIIKLQKICVRIIEKTDNYRAHTAPLFKKHRILPFPQLLDYNCAIFMHKYKYGKVPEIFNDKWNFQAENHNYSTRNRDNFVPRSHPRNFIFNAPLYYLPRKFNQLPIEIKSIVNEKEFSREVFSYLLNSII